MLLRPSTSLRPSRLAAVRRISRSTSLGAAPAPPVRPVAAASFQQVPPGTAAPTPAPHTYGPPPHELLDHSFVGLSGGEIFHEMMLRHDVKHIFGYPGGAILPVFDAIYNSPHFDFVLPRHEQGAGHMAEGYARVSGKPGVVLVTSGPGATNVITPLQDALSDGIPLVVFTGQVATSAIGSDAFQEADIVGISRSCTKWNVMVKDIAELPRRINEAFKIATSGRPGPVLVDLPKDVTASILRAALPFRQTTPGHAALGLPSNPLALPEPPTDPALILQAAALINQAQRPVIYAGAGVLSSPRGPLLLAQLAEQGNIPVCTTLQGLGAFDERHPRVCTCSACTAPHVIIALGGRFDDRVTGKIDAFAPAARAAAAQGRGGIIHFEILPKNVNKVVEATIPVLGDVVQNMAALVPHIRSSAREGWFADLAGWKKRYPFTYAPSAPGARMKPQAVVEALDAACADRKEDVVIATGVGQHQMWAAQHYRWTQPHSMVTSGGLGTMGFGLPAAIGAKVAAPHKTVVDIDGDASFSMTAMELATASQFGIGVKVLAMGVHAMRCDSADDLPSKMAEFLAYDNAKPILMECVVERNEHVFPMVRSPHL
ncbi:thiamine diphosphate-binding protein [Mycena latifolia]|nr:thiamine diphosphate-binding protein [Mycena latifolia]